MVTMESKDQLGPSESLDQQDHKETLVPQAHKEAKGYKEPGVPLDLLVPPSLGQLDQLDLKEPQGLKVHQEPKDQLELQEHPDPLAKLDLLETQELQEK